MKEKNTENKSGALGGGAKNFENFKNFNNPEMPKESENFENIKNSEMRKTPKKRAEKILDAVTCAAAAIVLANYALYLIKLVIFPEQTLAYIITLAVLLSVSLCIGLRKKLKGALKRAYPVFKGLFCACVIFYAVSFLALCAFIFSGSAAEVPPETLPDKTVFLVFGAKVNGSEESCYPGVSLKLRLDLARELLEAAPNSICVVSGGMGPDESRPEGEVMRDYLISKGISPERIISETKSKNTLENIDCSLALLKERGIGYENLACVSTNFHIPRIKLLCKKRGVEPICCYNAKAPEAFTLYTSLVREYMSYAKLLVFGHL